MPEDITAKLCKEGWTVQEFTIDTVETYNDFYYFHPFVRQAIFNKAGNTGMEYLARNDYNYLEVEYIYDDQSRNNCITTEVRSIDLHLFDNQIGLLTVTTEKCIDDNETAFPDLLRYNDISRRVYPPFLNSGKINTDKVKCDAKLLPSRMTLFHETDNSKTINECFGHVHLDSGNDIEYLSEIVRKLLYPFKLKESNRATEIEIYFTPFTDDRMFVVAYYAEKKVIDDLTKRCCDSYAYEKHVDWYRYLFVDGNSPSIANPSLMKELLRKHTYNRWVNSGSLYGISRYSLVMMGDNSDFCRNVLKQHMKSMYYQMALIVLFQRAMLLKFSDDIFDITKDSDFKNKPLDELQKRASDLQGDFIKFINKYWFIEITPQEQGTEMYNQWMGLLNIDKLYQEVEKEIAELSRYVEGKIEFERNKIESARNKIESDRNDRIEQVTIKAFWIAIIALIITFWQIYAPGLDSFDPLYTYSGIKQFLTEFKLLNSFLLLLLICIPVYIFIPKLIRELLNTKN
ncbi:MAG: hypothetical protein AB1499_10770 [Nitrospirota bacterium]